MIITTTKTVENMDMSDLVGNKFIYSQTEMKLIKFWCLLLNYRPFMKLQKYVSESTQHIYCSSHIYNDPNFSSYSFYFEALGESNRVETRCLIDNKGRQIAACSNSYSCASAVVILFQRIVACVFQVPRTVWDTFD